MWPFTRESRKRRREDRKTDKAVKQEAERRERSEWTAYLDAREKSAGVSSLLLVCHRDTWDFISTLLSQGSPHYTYWPPADDEITELPDGMREIRLSGPNLAALLVATWEGISQDFMTWRKAKRHPGQKLWNGQEIAIALRVHNAVSRAVRNIDSESVGGLAPPVVIIDSAPGGASDGKDRRQRPEIN